MIQQIAALEEIRHPASRFYFFRTHAGAEIDLIIDRGSERIGVERSARLEPRLEMQPHPVYVRRACRAQ